MDRSFRSGLMLLAGITLLGLAVAAYAILLEGSWWIGLVGLAGGALLAVGLIGLRGQLGGMVGRRRLEIAAFTFGVLGILVALGYLSVRYPLRFDLTTAGLHSLAPQTVTMLERLERPVEVVFFHDPKMRQTVELYQLMADQSDQISVRFHDPMLDPAQARLSGVQFAGTAIMTSEDRKLQVHGQTETDIANGILRVSQAVQQLVCFLDGHGEGDPFSKEAHDHLEGIGGDHDHGMGAQYVLHERHGMAKARSGLENLNYRVEKVSTLRAQDALDACAVLVVAGPKVALLPDEVAAVRAYLDRGGNALFMLEPFVPTGLEPVIRDYGIVVDDTIVIDAASHFWADPSAPAVSDYNRHQVTRALPLTFYPGVRSLSPTPERVPGTAVVALANSSTNSFAETNPERAELDEDEDLAGPVTLMAIANRRPVDADGPTLASLGPDRPAGAARGDAVNGDAAGGGSTAEARSRIAVVGDADFATNSFFHFLGNGNLFLNVINYLAARENLIGVEPRTYDLPQLSMTNRQMKGTLFLSVILIPGLLAVVGTAVWWRQR